MVSVAVLLVLLYLVMLLNTLYAAGVPFGVSVGGDGYNAGGKHKVMVQQLKS